MDSMYSYMESRGGCTDSVVFFGLQYILKEFLTQPITDTGKNSKRGRLALIRHKDSFVTLSVEDAGTADVMRVVFENGVLKNEISFEEVRANSIIGI